MNTSRLMPLAICLALMPGLSRAAVSLFPHPDIPFLSMVYVDPRYAHDYLTVADLNADGIPDLLSTGGVNLVTVIIGNGDGTFGSLLRTSVEDGYGFFQPAVTDFDGDGWPDLAIGNQDSVVPILLGQGDGTFQEVAGPFAWSRPISVMANDFDLDGLPDLATVFWNGSHVSFHGGLGDGSFESLVGFEIGYNPYRAVAEDFNGDGLSDVAAACWAWYGDWPPSISTLLGRGDGTFLPRIKTPLDEDSGYMKSVLLAAEFNGDGRLDLATLSDPATLALGGPATVLMGRGDGSFEPEIALDLCANNPGYCRDTAVTFDAYDHPADGMAELAVGKVDQVLFFSRPDPGESQPDGFLDYDGVRALRVADVDLDGRPDLIVMNRAGNLSIFPLGAGSSLPAPPRWPVGANPVSLIIDHLDDDSHLDMIVANQQADIAEGSVSVLLGRGDGTFLDEKRSGMWRETGAVAVGELTGDEHKDIVVGLNDVRRFVILRGDGSGQFTPQAYLAAGDGSKSVAIADFNGDGHGDVAAANRATADITVVLGNGDGSFLSAGTVPTGEEPLSLVASDLNNDRLADLITANFGSNDASVLMAVGDGSFSPLENIQTGVRPESVATGDFDGDGVVDLVVANRGSDDLLVLTGRGDGRFDPVFLLEEIWCPREVVVGDLNNDTRLDLAVKSSATPAFCGAPRVAVHLGLGDGSFRPEAAYSVGIYPYSIAIGDLDEDGRNDIALSVYGSASFESGVVSAFFNQGPLPAVLVEIDVLPGAPVNPLNLKSRGVVPVAVLSSQEIDALTVLPETVRLAGAPVRRAGSGGRCLCHESDVDADGLTDLVCQVETSEIRIEGADLTLVLEAATTDGRRIRGEDTVGIVP
jgi:hypothetical protein